jgi:hypothetical protein
MFILSAVIQYNLIQSNKQEKEVKVIQIRKEEVKFSLFATDMMLHIKDLKDSSRKTLTSDKHFQQRSGYKLKYKTWSLLIHQQ